MTQALTVVRGLKGLFIASEDVTRRTFMPMPAPQVAQGTAGIQALQFARLVTHAERPVFESRVARDTSLAPPRLPRFRITRRNARFMATEYNEPMAGNEATMGFDSPLARRAPPCTSGRVTATSCWRQHRSAWSRCRPGRRRDRAPLYQADRPVETVEQRRAAVLRAGFRLDRGGPACGGGCGGILAPTPRSPSRTSAPSQPAANLAAQTPCSALWRPAEGLVLAYRADGQRASRGRGTAVAAKCEPVRSPYLQAKALLAGALALALTLLMLAELNRAMGQAGRTAATRFCSQLEATVEARTAELTRVNAEMEAFAYSVAHDLPGAGTSTASRGC